MKTLSETFIKIWWILVKSYRKFLDDRGFIIANGMAFKTMLALIPISVVFLGVYASFSSFAIYKDKIINMLLQYLIPGSVESIIVQAEAILNNTKAISTVGSIAFIYLSLDLFVTLDNQINHNWVSHVKRSFMQKVLIYWALLTAMPIVLAGYFYYAGLFKAIVTPIIKMSTNDHFYDSFLIFVLLDGFFLFVYYTIPNIKVHLSKAFIVATIVAITWIGLRYIFTYYTRLTIGNWKIYGSLAAIVLFMLWISINWIILHIFINLQTSFMNLKVP